MSPASQSHAARIYRCQCGKPIFFRNSLCLNCQTPVGFAPSAGRLLPLKDTGGDTFALIGVDDRTLFKRCENAQSAGACNWLVPLLEHDAGQVLCYSCRLNRTIPNLTAMANTEYWGAIELAKRRLVSGLLALRLPVKSKVSEDPQCGLAFDFLENPFDGPPYSQGMRTESLL
jgi:hypothetical protein